MTSKHLIAGVVAAGLFGMTSSSVQASATAPKSCVFDKHAPISAHAYSGTDTTVDWGAFPTSHGVQLFVPAYEGLTKEWLNVSVQHALDSAHHADSYPAAQAWPCSQPALLQPCFAIEMNRHEPLLLIGHQ